MQLLHHRIFQRTSHAAANTGLMPRGSFRHLCSYFFHTGTICAGTSDSSSTLLTADTLELSLRTVQGAKLLQTQLQPVPTDATAIKTMVLVQDSPAAESSEPEPAEHTALAAEPAVAVLLLAGHKVDLRAVAQHLQLPRGSLRLATADEAVASTGYELGCIPPLGHRHQLRTLVDEHIMQHTPDQLLCAGGGAAGVQLLLEVEQLLVATAGEAGSFSTSKLQAVKAPLQTELLQQQQQGQLLQQQMSYQATFLHLPLPWADGDECVELVGVLAQRRRIAKLLLFATLVPETVPALPSTGTAAYVRRLWRQPSTGTPCEVQLIMGKTLERRLGREGAAALFDKLKVGAVVALSGRVQQHPQQQAGGSTAHQHVLDVVVSDIRMLHKNRDTLARAISAVQRQGHTSITPALQLDQLLAGQAASSTAGMPPAADLASTLAPASQRPPAAAALPAAASGVVGKASAARAQSGVTVTGPGSQSAQQDTTSAAGQQQKQQFCNFPLPLSQVAFVQDLEGVVHMHQKILGQVLQQQQPPAPSSSSSPTPVVGLDAEWQPYERGQPRTPVALLQLATRQEVFVIDLLALCRQPGPQSPSMDHTTSSNGSNSTTTDDLLTEQSSQSEQEDPSTTSTLPCSRSSMQVSQDDVSSAVLCQEPPAPSEMALCEFLQQLFSTDSIKVIGFQLLGDLQRLAQSYPWLLPSRVASAAAAAAAADGLVASSSSIASQHNSSPSGSRWPSDGAQTFWVAADNTLVWPAASAAAPGIPGDCDGWVVRQAVDLQRLNKLVDPHSRQGSLSALVNRTLGKPLDKAQQASGWAARPLTEEQLVYAANDAHVLTALYDKLAAKL